MMPQTMQLLALAGVLWSATATIGRGEFHELPAEARGHYLWLQPDRWAPLVESYLKRRGLPSEKP
jgi:hypothetical protein